MEKDFTYYPKYLEDVFEEVYEEIKDKVVAQTKGRSSCFFTLHEIDLFEMLGESSANYNAKYKIVPEIIKKIRREVEILSKVIYDYVLVHIYRDGGGISWHNDKEALNSTIASVSFGITRNFRLKKMDRKTGYDYELNLGPGDVLIMHPGCQKRYLHTIPSSSSPSVSGIRINLTFRQYELR